MGPLEVLFWLALGSLIAVAKLRFGELPRPPARDARTTVLLCAAAALGGGLLGLAVIRPSPRLGDFNVASIVLSCTAAALALLTQSAIREHRADGRRAF